MAENSDKGGPRADRPGTAAEVEPTRTLEGILVLRLAGDWTLDRPLPAIDAVVREWEPGPDLRGVAFDTAGLGDWDSGLLTFLSHARAWGAARNLPVETGGLPAGVRRLLDLASAVPERTGARREAARESVLARVGGLALRARDRHREMLAFIGEVTVASGRLLRGRARLRRADLLVLMQECGARALPIVSLIAFLVGLILAFIGAIQLRMFGAQAYVADLVGISMVRVMAAVMTGIILAGRTGASYAARLGTMQVNEEIDALKAMGISPVEFLVLPRILALALMTPLLGLYADLMGILGGLVIGVGLLDLGLAQYYQQTRAAVDLTNVWIGLVHAAVFGVLVAVAGCLRGIQCGRSAQAVGEATTSAVVSGIVSIVVATAVITVACHVLGI